MDDFSFPTLAVEPDAVCQLPFPHFTASPLWFLSSVSEPKAARQRWSFSSAEDAVAGMDPNVDLGSTGTHPSSPALSNGGHGGRFPENEKMDLLWEDFNEELARLSHHKRQASERSRGEAAPGGAALQPTGVGSRYRKGSREAKADLPGTPALGAKNSRVIQHRRPSLVVMLKLLKRLFLIQNPRSSRKTRHCDEVQDAPRVS